MATCALPGAPLDTPVFSASAQPYIAASRHAPGLALTASDCLQSRGRLAVFPFAFRRGRPLGVDKWVKVLIALGARSPSAKSGSSLLVSGVDQSSEPPGWGGEGRVQTPSFPEEAWTLMRDVFCPDPASSPRVTPHRLLTEVPGYQAQISRDRFHVSPPPTAASGAPSTLDPGAGPGATRVFGQGACTQRGSWGCGRRAPRVASCPPRAPPSLRVLTP